MNDVNLKEVYWAANLADAQLVVEMLQGAGIEAQIVGEALQGAVGEIAPQSAQPRVWVRGGDAERARTLIQQHSGPSAEALPWICKGCGETNAASFEICWDCGRPANPLANDP